jgi:hypothetical protein
MKWSWTNIKTALLIAEKVAVIAGDHGVTVKGLNPAEVDAAAHTAAATFIQSVKKKGHNILG